MSGREYLEDIRTELESGRHQWRMGENILRAFGYVIPIRFDYATNLP